MNCSDIVTYRGGFAPIRKIKRVARAIRKLYLRVLIAIRNDSQRADQMERRLSEIKNEQIAKNNENYFRLY